MSASTFEITTTSEIAVAYALHTLGMNARESVIMRLRMADALREMHHPQAAQEVEESVRVHSVKVDGWIP